MRKTFWRSWALAPAAAWLLASGWSAVTAQPPALAAGCNGVSVTPASDIQNLIDSHPSGTMFCFAPGTYSNASGLQPQSGDTFDGDGQQAVLDGGNSAQYAFYGDANDTGPSGVTIQGFRIQHYATPLQRGAIQDYNGPKWIIQDNDIEDNAAAAVATGDGVTVTGNKLDNNKQEGFSAHGGGLYQGNDISGNNSGLNSGGPCGCAWTSWESGGGKAWATTGLTFSHNTVERNGGPGLWADTSNLNTVYENNTVSDNWGPGIYEEVSYAFTITGNDITGNGLGEKMGWAWDAGIQIRESQGGVQGYGTSVISGNTVADNFNGISLLDSPADGCTNTANGEGAYGPCQVRDVSVTGNGITMKQGSSGAYQDGMGDQIFTSENVTWAKNAYCIPAGYASGTVLGGPLQWNDGTVNWSQWQAAGNDASGSYTTTDSACIPPGGTAQAGAGTGTGGSTGNPALASTPSSTPPSAPSQTRKHHTTSCTT